MRRIVQILLLFVMLVPGVAYAGMESIVDIKRKQYDKVRPKQEILLRDLQGATDPRERYHIYDELTKLFYNQIDEVPYIEKKLEIAISLEERNLELDCYVDMCRNYNSFDNIKMVREYCAKVEKITGGKGHHWMLAKYYEVEVLYWNGNMRDAWNELQELERYAAEVHDEIVDAIVAVLNADIYSFLSQDDKAYELTEKFFPVLSKQQEGYYVQMAYMTATESAFYMGNVEESMRLVKEWDELLKSGRFDNDRCMEEMRWNVALEYLNIYVFNNDVDKVKEYLDQIWNNNYIPTEWSLIQFALMRAMVNRDFGNIEDVETDVDYLLQQRSRYHHLYYTVLAAAYWKVGMMPKSAKAFRDANDALSNNMRETMIREVEQYGELSKRFSEETALDDTRLREGRNLNIALTVGVALALLSLFVLIGLLFRNVKISRKLKQMNSRIEDNSKRVAAVNSNLANAINQEEESCRKKNEFIANISHEIRTPLNAIVGFSEILAASCENNEESKEFTQIIRANSDLMLDLVNQIIEERDDERTSLHLEKINVTELARTSLYSLSALIADNVKLVYRCDQPEVMLTTDRYRLQQLLTNLLGNAAKFTSEGSITLELAVDEHYVTFSVIDTGCGIPKGKENSIFEEFEKGSETSTGSGLGLFICRSISNQLYGQLYVDASYTQGAKFVFQHPTMLQSMMSDQVKE